MFPEFLRRERLRLPVVSAIQCSHSAQQVHSKSFLPAAQRSDRPVLCKHEQGTHLFRRLPLEPGIVQIPARCVTAKHRCRRDHDATQRFVQHSSGGSWASCMARSGAGPAQQDVSFVAEVEEDGTVLLPVLVTDKVALLVPSGGMLCFLRTVSCLQMACLGLHSHCCTWMHGRNAAQQCLPRCSGREWCCAISRCTATSGRDPPSGQGRARWRACTVRAGQMDAPQRIPTGTDMSR